jgi:ABC-type amino acid transport substrate-binding protein
LGRSDFERTAVKSADVTVFVGLSPDVAKATVNAWQAARDAMKASGEYAAIMTRYSGD